MALKALWQRTTVVDRGLILLLAVAALASLPLLLERDVGKQVMVYAGERLVFAGPLNQERQLDVHGPLGDTRVEIHGGKVRVLDSPCPRKICISMGVAYRSGDLLACVPNRVVVRIEGEAEEGYDLLSR